jgi:hypothetical protein
MFLDLLLLDSMGDLDIGAGSSTRNIITFLDLLWDFSNSMDLYGQHLSM